MTPAKSKTLVLALMVIAVGCGPESTSGEEPAKQDTPPVEPASEPGEPEPEPVTGLEGTHVVVASGVRLFPSADATKPVVTRSYLEDREFGRIHASHLGWVMKVGEVQGDRVEVSLMPGDMPAVNCGRGMGGLDAFALKGWVEHSSLVSVTTARAQLSYEDGSSIVLPPGIPVLPASEDASQRIDIWGFELGIEDAKVVDHDALPLGLAFTPAELPAFPGELGELGYRALRLAGEPLEHLFLRQDEGYLRTEREVEGKVMVRIRGRCVEVEALVDGSTAGLGHGVLGGIGTIGGGYGAMDQQLFLAIPAGTSIRWSDGSPAGEVRSDQRLLATKAPGEGRCVYVNAGDRHQQVALCFASEDVEDLRLGWLRPSEIEQKPKGELGDSQLRYLTNRLREACLSYALDEDPELDVRVKVEAHYGPEDANEPGKVEVKAAEGKLGADLRACLIEEIAAWKYPGLAEHELRFDMRLAGKHPVDAPR